MAALSKRYRNLYIPSDFCHLSASWVEALPDWDPLPLAHHVGMKIVKVGGPAFCWCCNSALCIIYTVARRPVMGDLQNAPKVSEWILTEVWRPPYACPTKCSRLELLARVVGSLCANMHPQAEKQTEKQAEARASEAPEEKKEEAAADEPASLVPASDASTPGKRWGARVVLMSGVNQRCRPAVK